jgi:hypothetical protein
MSQNSPENISSRELATLLKTWLLDTVKTELEKNRPAPPSTRPTEELGTMLDKRSQDNSAARKVRARRFREALAGLETLLMGATEIEYRTILDRVLHNIGANLMALELFEPQQPLTNVPELDYRTLSSFPAKAVVRRYVALPRMTRTLAELGLNHFWLAGAQAYLTEYREWQPRLLLRAKHDTVRLGLFVWSDVASRDVCFFPMGIVPGGRVMGTNELVMLGQKETFMSRWMDDTPRRDEHFFRLSARDFTGLLRALLLDYEAIYTTRQREVAEQDQLGSMLWDFLSREDTE